MDILSDSFSGFGSGMVTNNSMLTDNETIVDELTCEERQVEFGFPLPLPSNIANVLRYIQTTYYIVCFPFGVGLNLLVILLVLRYKRLQNITFYLALQVLVFDLINALIVFPTSAANTIADRYVFTGLCTTIGFIVFYLRIVRIYLMFVLVLDRFLTVIMPFWYQRHRVKVILPLSLGAWTVSFIIALIPVRGILDCYSFQRNTWACVPTNGCNHRNECSVYNSTAIALSNFCNVTSLLLYAILFIKARQIRNKIFILHEPESRSQEERAAATQKIKQERRANVTFFVLFLALAGVSFLPFIFFVVGRPIITSLGIVPHPGYTIAGVIGRSMYPLLTIIDPIVIMRNEDFREVIKKVLREIKVLKSPNGQTQNITTSTANETTTSS